MIGCYMDQFWQNSAQISPLNPNWREKVQDEISVCRVQAACSVKWLAQFDNIDSGVNISFFRWPEHMKRFQPNQGAIDYMIRRKISFIRPLRS